MANTIDSGLGAASPAQAQATGSASKPLDREAFLKLLVAQISNQDPLKPMEGTEFVAQLSQFAVVEQSVDQSKKLDLLATQLRGIAYNDAASLVGKTVTVRGKGIAFDGLSATSASVTLGGAAAQTSATIKDASGKVVRTIEIGPRPPGVVPITWDGRDDSGQTLPPGSYTLDVKATAADGSAVSSTSDVVGVVTKVSFDKGYPELSLDTGASAPVSDLVGVGVAGK